MFDRLLGRVRFTEWRGNVDGRATFWSRRLLRALGRAVDLHCIVAPDDEGCFHSHPGYAIRIILSGGYIEEYADGRAGVWRPGMVGIVRPTDTHRIAALLTCGPSYSLWIRGRKIAPIRLIGPGWPDDLRSPEVPE